MPEFRNSLRVPCGGDARKAKAGRFPEEKGGRSRGERKHLRPRRSGLDVLCCSRAETTEMASRENQKANKNKKKKKKTPEKIDLYLHHRRKQTLQYKQGGMKGTSSPTPGGSEGALIPERSRKAKLLGKPRSHGGGGEKKNRSYL